jgi:hypothetical protein
VVAGLPWPMLLPRRYSLYVNDFFMKRAKSFMGTVVKKALGIKHYWGRVEFAPGRGAFIYT